MKSVMIEQRFCGPPKSANGGYVCGLVANYIECCAEVTLMAPPPLGQRLDVVSSEAGVELRKDETVLAKGRGVHLNIPEIPIVEFAEAEDAVHSSPYDEARHPLPIRLAYAEEHEATTERPHVANIGELTGIAGAANVGGYDLLPRAPGTTSAPVQPLGSR